MSGHSRTEYCHREDLNIVKYLKIKDAFDMTNGNLIWKQMEKDKVCPGRTFQSLRNRFLRNIRKRLNCDFKHILCKSPSSLRLDNLAPKRSTNIEPVISPPAAPPEPSYDKRLYAWPDKHLYDDPFGESLERPTPRPASNSPHKPSACAPSTQTSSLKSFKTFKKNEAVKVNTTAQISSSSRVEVNEDEWITAHPTNDDGETQEPSTSNHQQSSTSHRSQTINKSSKDKTLRVNPKRRRLYSDTSEEVFLSDSDENIDGEHVDNLMGCPVWKKTLVGSNGTADNVSVRVGRKRVATLDGTMPEKSGGTAEKLSEVVTSSRTVAICPIVEESVSVSNHAQCRNQNNLAVPNQAEAAKTPDGIEILSQIDVQKEPLPKAIVRLTRINLEAVSEKQTLGTLQSSAGTVSKSTVRVRPYSSSQGSDVNQEVTGKSNQKETRESNQVETTVNGEENFAETQEVIEIQTDGNIIAVHTTSDPHNVRCRVPVTETLLKSPKQVGTIPQVVEPPIRQPEPVTEAIVVETPQQIGETHQLQESTNRTPESYRPPEPVGTPELHRPFQPVRTPELHRAPEPVRTSSEPNSQRDLFPNEAEVPSSTESQTFLTCTTASLAYLGLRPVADSQKVEKAEMFQRRIQTRLCASRRRVCSEASASRDEENVKKKVLSVSDIVHCNIDPMLPDATKVQKKGVGRKVRNCNEVSRRIIELHKVIGPLKRINNRRHLQLLNSLVLTIQKLRDPRKLPMKNKMVSAENKRSSEGKANSTQPTTSSSSSTTCVFVDALSATPHSTPTDAENQSSSSLHDDSSSMSRQKTVASLAPKDPHNNDSLLLPLRKSPRKKRPSTFLLDAKNEKSLSTPTDKHKTTNSPYSRHAKRANSLSSIFSKRTACSPSERPKSSPTSSEKGKSLSTPTETETLALPTSRVSRIASPSLRSKRTACSPSERSKSSRTSPEKEKSLSTPTKTETLRQPTSGVLKTTHSLPSLRSKRTACSPSSPERPKSSPTSPENYKSLSARTRSEKKNPNLAVLTTPPMSNDKSLSPAKSRKTPDFPIKLSISRPSKSSTPLHRDNNPNIPFSPPDILPKPTLMTSPKFICIGHHATSVHRITSPNKLNVLTALQVVKDEPLSTSESRQMSSYPFKLTIPRPSKSSTPLHRDGSPNRIASIPSPKSPHRQNNETQMASHPRSPLEIIDTEATTRQSPRKRASLLRNMLSCLDKNESHKIKEAFEKRANH